MRGVWPLTPRDPCGRNPAPYRPSAATTAGICCGDRPRRWHPSRTVLGGVHMCGKTIALPTRVPEPVVPTSAVPLRAGLACRADAFQGARVSESPCIAAGWPCWGDAACQPAGVVGRGERFRPIGPRRVLAAMVLAHTPHRSHLGVPGLEPQVLEFVYRSDMATWRGVVNALLEAEDMPMALLPGADLPCRHQALAIRRCCRSTVVMNITCRWSGNVRGNHVPCLCSPARQDAVCLSDRLAQGTNCTAHLEGCAP